MTSKPNDLLAVCQSLLVAYCELTKRAYAPNGPIEASAKDTKAAVELQIRAKAAIDLAEVRESRG